MPAPTRICFVCLGNICRSPTAEGIFRHLVNEREQQDAYVIGSFGTGGWHVGEPPDPRAQATARAHGIDISSYRGARITVDDLHDWDWIVAMDTSNLHNLEDLNIVAGAPARIVLFGTLLPTDHPLYGQDVMDPYYNPEGFEEVFSMISNGCKEFLSKNITS